MSKSILITGAASGFGKGAAIDLARHGHTVIAGVQIAPQATELIATAAEAGVELNVIVLDITDDDDRQSAFANEIDVLINNAGIMETGPVAEIPMSRVRRNYETNVFGTLAMCQGRLACAAGRRGCLQVPQRHPPGDHPVDSGHPSQHLGSR